MRPLIPALLLLAAACGPAAPSTANFAWQGSVPEGAWVRIRNGTGNIEIRRSPDGRVAVGAEVRTGGRQVTWRRDSSEQAMTFCVLPGRDADAGCDRAGMTPRASVASRVRRMLSGGRAGGTSVKYVLYVPADASVDVRTVNGAIDLRSVVRDFKGRTVNGAINMVAVAGGIDVETVNGSIDATLGLEGDGAISLKSVNGSVKAELPASLAGEVTLATVNGRVTSDFELGDASRRQHHGTLGGGGRPVTLKTVNGSVTLRRRA